MRKWTCYALAMLLLCAQAAPAAAEIEPARGEIMYYTDLYGHYCVVLCETLSGRAEPSYDAPVTDTFSYGDGIIVNDRQGEWMSVVVMRDGSAVCWVREEYVLQDPAHYITEVETPVYAYDAPDSPRVALVPEGTNLPIIKALDGGYVVSLRGASGFVRK